MNADFSKLFFRNTDPMWIFDPQSLYFLAVNDAAVCEYGYKKQDFQAMSILDIRPHNDRDIVQKALKDVIGDNLFMNTYRHLRRDRTVREVQIARYEIDYDDRKAFLVKPIPVNEDPTLRSFHKLFEKVNFALLQKIGNEQKRIAEIRKLAKLLVAGQPVSKQIAIITRIHALLDDAPGAGLN